MSSSNKIFLLKNEYKNGLKHKYVSIFGHKFYITNLMIPRYIDFIKFLGLKFHKVKKNTVLIVEANTCHYETIPGYYKYLSDLGYNVEFLLNEAFCDGLFSKIQNKIKLFKISNYTLVDIFKFFDFKDYELVVFNSKLIYQNGPTDINTFIKTMPKCNRIFVQHHINRISEVAADTQIILANPDKLPELENKVVNPHYFGEVNITSKNQVTNFITIGALEPERRNIQILIKAVKKMLERGIKNFKVTIIGRGKVETLPEDIREFFEIKGRIKYDKMFAELEKADFILPLLSPENSEHERYKHNGTTGTFQLVYGFLKPCIIYKEFADIYDFNEKNSLIYDKDENFDIAMEKAININNENYKQLQDNIKLKAQKLEETSLHNLENIIKTLKNN